MQNYSSLNEINEMFSEKKYNKKILVEAKLGSIIMKDPTQVQMAQLDQDDIVNAQSIMKKNCYRFESAISKQDFSKAKKSYPKNIISQEKSLDLNIELSSYVKLAFRIVMDGSGKIFCYEKFKEQKQKHIDVIDCGRIYRISATERNLQSYPQPNIFIQKIKDTIANSGKRIQCARYKQEQIHQDDLISDSYIYQVQQIDRGQKSTDFINLITEQLFNETNSLKINIQLIFDQFQQQGKYVLNSLANYFKPYYEAEVHLKEKADDIYPEEFLEKVREFYENVIFNNKQIKNEDQSDRIIKSSHNQNRNQNSQQKKAYQQQFTTGPTKTRGQQRQVNQPSQQERYEHNQQQGKQSQKYQQQNNADREDDDYNYYDDD